MPASLHLDVVIDVVCPWCFVGKRQLDAAMASLPDVGFTVRYRAFQLDPTIPPQGKDRRKYLMDKFGDPARIAAMHERIASIGADLGIAFDFDAIKVSPNSFDLHRLIHFATAEGKADGMVERLFSLYFEEGADLTRADTLADAAASVGLDRDRVIRDLASGRDRAAVEEELAFAARVGIDGVPCTIIASRWAISGAQPPIALADAFRQILAEQAAA